MRVLALLALVSPCTGMQAVARVRTAPCARSNLHSYTMLSLRPTLLLAALEAGTSQAQRLALCANAAAGGVNAIAYVSPLRGAVIKALYGAEAGQFFSPVSGAFMYLGGMHAAVAMQCVAALLGLRSAAETLKLMLAIHAVQATIGLWRALKTASAGKLATPTVDTWLGAGCGPAIGALLLGSASLAALR